LLAFASDELDCARSIPGAVVFSVVPRDASSSLYVAANMLQHLE